MGPILRKLFFLCTGFVRPYAKFIPMSLKTYVRKNLANKLLKHDYDYSRIAKPRMEDGVNIIGFPFRYTGIAQQMRFLIEDLQSKNIPFSLIDYDNGVAMEKSEFKDLEQYLVACPVKNKINIWVTNFHNMRPAYFEKGRHFFDNCYNIGYFPWEYETMEGDSVNDLRLCDEIWCISDFVTDTLKRYHDAVPYTTYHIPVQVDSSALLARSDFGLLDDKVVFMFAFDFNSSLERKNPMATYRSFCLAFDDRDKYSDVMLVIKVHSSNKLCSRYKSFLSELKRDSRVKLFDQTMSSVKMLSLINCSDAIVSLHRSEGYGILMREAQLLDKYVIATGYSGNVEFMRGHSKSFLVDYKVIDKQKSVGYFWADVDISDAVTKMQNVYDRVRGM